MAAHPVTHPSADVLKAFALGKLNDPTAAAVMSHLDSCPDCCKQAAALSGDDFLNRLRQAHGRSSTPAPAKPLGDVPRVPQASAKQPPIANLPPELAANQQYEILRELGRGGMGVVYLAKNKLMDRLEVLKVVNKALLDRPAAVERFLREIRSAAKLSHANVVTAHSAMQMGELLVFAMEYIEGQDLASLVKSQGPLPIPHACFYVQQAAWGLQHAFEKQMVHRDIKPQNLILAREGRKHIVKVLDFGLAKVMREKSDDTGLTGEGKMLGTPDYIAPEQTLDAAKADIRADIYSLGCTLYFLLAGHPPFSANSLGAMLLAHQMHEAKPLNLVRPEVPEDLAAVVRKMMAKTPAKRYQTPLQVAEALAPFIKRGGTQKSSLELSSGSVEVKSVAPKAQRVDPAPAPAAEGQQQPSPVSVWESLAEGSIAPSGPRRRERFSDLTIVSLLARSISFLGPRKSGPSRKRRAATIRGRRSQKKWLMGGGIGAGMLLLALLGMWAGGVFKVKTSDGILVVEVNEANPDVFIDGEKMTVTWDQGGKKAEIHVAPGTRKVEITKDGFTAHGEVVALADGGRRIITARLEKTLTAAPGSAEPGSASDFVPLFNGKDLSGWAVDGGPPGQWVVEGNTIVAQSKDARTRNYLLTEKDYDHFVLRLDYKLEVESNGGVAIRAMEGEKVPLNNKPRFDHPVILLAHAANNHPTGTTPWLRNAGHSDPIEILARPTGVWHSMEVTVRADTCTATIDGKRIVNVSLDPAFQSSDDFVPGLGRGKGKVGFLIHSGIARYRKIEIKELPPMQPAGEGFISLFNGKDLTGWKPDPKQPGNWRVVKSDGGDILTGFGPALSHLYTLRGGFKDFHLRMEIRINDGGQGGVFFRAPFGLVFPAQNPFCPLGYEVKINSTHPEERKTGSLVIVENANHVSMDLVRESPVPHSKWFKMEVIAKGNHFVIKVDGKEIKEHTDEKRLFTSGHIVLQHYDAASVVEFRKIEIKELSAAKAEAPAATDESLPPASPRRAEDTAAEKGKKQNAAIPPSPPSAESGLPPEAKEAAKEFEKARDDARAKLLAEFDTALDRWAKMKGAADLRLKMIKVLNEEKARFESRGLIPWSEPMRPFLAKYLVSTSVAEERLRRVYISLIAAQNKAKNDSMVADLQANLSSLLSVRVAARWSHFWDGKFNHNVTLYSNGRVGKVDGNSIWNYDKGVLIYRWPHTDVPGGIAIDRFQVSPDGMTYDGTCNIPALKKVKIHGVYLKDD